MADTNIYEYQVIPTNKPVDLCNNLIPTEHSNKLNGLLILFYDKSDIVISLYMYTHRYTHTYIYVNEI